MNGILGIFGAAWGLAGLIGLLVFAVYRLGGVVVAGLEWPWGWEHVAVAGVNAVFMAWSEGWRGFQRSFSPRVAARLKWLRDNPATVRVVFAPLFAVGYFGATRERLIGIYALTAAIVVLIVVVHLLPQPWRAALDIGVILGLTWGIVSTLACAWRALGGDTYDVAPDVP
ncbi:MAG: hypothetical protein OXU77_17925 [Gammaproteobacteria bacterium]|nr:hypothetical protein [Gammaproteobacteria bacterium]MDE0441082.1 hypothetical protein [Gammaproteobacteria bacterium]